MRLLNLNRPSSIFSPFIQKRFVHHHKELEEGPGGLERFIGWHRSNPAKANRNTHINERKYRRLRGAKRLLVDLDEERMELQEKMEGMMPDETRMYLLRKGKPNLFKDISPRDWNEHQLTLNTFGQTLDQYIPPENSWFSRRGGPKDIYEGLKTSTKRTYHNFVYGARRIRKKEGFEKFDVKAFPKQAEAIYINAYNALMNRDRQKLHDLITERAFSKLWPDVERGTLHWKLLHFNEPSKVLTVRCMDYPQNSGNDIAQITVRMHSTQILALYDKDGHLLLDSETEPRECLEYVVFENHISSLLGLWRLHDRIVPDWLEPKQPLRDGPIGDSEREKLPEKPIKLTHGMDDTLKAMKERENRQ